MARSLNMALLAAVLVAALVQNSAAQTLHTVGNSMGWVIPSSGAITYTVWAANQNFTVGDTLVFNFATGSHDVAKVTKADYDACTTSNPIFVENTGPANIKLNATGKHYFICNYTGHCSAGQKLAINVSAAVTTSPSPSPSTQPSTAPSPAPPAGTTTPVSTPLSAPVSSPTPSSTSPPTSAPPPSLSSSPVTYRVGDISMNWTVPASNTNYYQTWAANKSFKVGDILVFNYASGRHDVAEVTKEAYESCNATSATTKSAYTTPPTAITLNTSGEHFFICRFTQHCPLGQKLAINVTGTAATTAPSPSQSDSPSSPPTTSTATPPSSSSANPPSSSTAPSTLAPSGGSAPPPSSATSLGVAGVSATLFSILVALFLC